ncbi:MAG: hypothetical protein HYU28_03770 [Actinobacteria bacterium]|nr:hypothetical protein [Actinomycetota bacterium]
MAASLVARARWIRGPLADTALALGWVPFSLAALALDHDPDQLNRLLAATFLVSFLHQPLTLALVYGDPDQFATRRRLFTWSPAVFVVAVTVGMNVSLALVAFVAGAWNAVHTLMQRFGMIRIYARKAGEGSEGAALERAMLVSWLVLALVWVAADGSTPETVAGLALGTVNARAINILDSLRPVASLALLPCAFTVLGIGRRWVGAERARGAAANPAKHLYVASTAALFATILVAPVAGFIGYVGSHAIEYFAVVDHSLGGRYGTAGGGALGRAVRGAGPSVVVAAIVAAAFGLHLILGQFGDERPLTWVILAAGGLHVFYDGFIWKLRRPEVAVSLNLAPVQSNPAAA